MKKSEWVHIYINKHATSGVFFGCEKRGQTYYIFRPGRYTEYIRSFGCVIHSPSIGWAPTGRREMCLVGPNWSGKTTPIQTSDLYCRREFLYRIMRVSPGSRVRGLFRCLRSVVRKVLGPILFAVL